MADRLAVKVSRSVGKSKVVQARRKEWEDVNVVRGRRNKGGFEVLAVADEEEEGNGNEQRLEIVEVRKFGDGDVPLDPEGPTVLPMLGKPPPSKGAELDGVVEKQDTRPTEVDVPDEL